MNKTTGIDGEGSPTLKETWNPTIILRVQQRNMSEGNLYLGYKEILQQAFQSTHGNTKWVDVPIVDDSGNTINQ